MCTWSDLHPKMTRWPFSFELWTELSMTDRRKIDEDIRPMRGAHGQLKQMRPTDRLKYLTNCTMNWAKMTAMTKEGLMWIRARLQLVESADFHSISIVIMRRAAVYSCMLRLLLHFFSFFAGGSSETLCATNNARHILTARQRRSAIHTLWFVWRTESRHVFKRKYRPRLHFFPSHLNRTQIDTCRMLNANKSAWIVSSEPGFSRCRHFWLRAVDVPGRSSFDRNSMLK